MFVSLCVALLICELFQNNNWIEFFLRKKYFVCFCMKKFTRCLLKIHFFLFWKESFGCWKIAASSFANWPLSHRMNDELSECCKTSKWALHILHFRSLYLRPFPWVLTMWSNIITLSCAFLLYRVSFLDWHEIFSIIYRIQLSNRSKLTHFGVDGAI